jgi:fructoselysine-6-P-deglycase FrlB-like protein
MGVAETSGWYDPAVYPELRSAAPWVMEDMIEAQVMLPEALGDSLASSASQLVEMMHAAADAGEPIVVSAVGTSGHSARAVALILNDAMGESAVAAGPAEARESADEALAPRRRGLCIAISHGGLSTSTVRALAAAREAGAMTALVTAADNARQVVLSHGRLYLADAGRILPRLGIPPGRVPGSWPRPVPG